MARLLWRFNSEHIREGPFDGMPLLLHATPIPTNANHFEYIVHLTTATQVNIIALVQAYCRRSNIRILSQNEILDLDSFTYPSTIGGNPKELRRPPGATNVRGIQPDVIEDIMEQVQSEELRDILDLKWTTVINVAQIREIATRGRGSDGVPKFLKKANHKHTWEDIKFNREPVNCAAFALCNFVSNRGKYQERLDFSAKGRKCRERSRKFQDRLGWGDSVNLGQIEDFVKVFTEYQVTVFMPNPRTPEASFFKVYTGESFVDSLNSIDLVHYKDHWAWCGSIQGFIDQMKHGGCFTFCRVCLHVIKNPQKLNLSQLPCHVSEPSAKKVKLQAVCPAPQCEGDRHKKSECSFVECPACGTLNKNNSHRCCLLPRSFGNPHPHEKYWDNDCKDYAFCVDEDGDGKTPAFFSYDMETMIKTTTIKPIDPKNLVRPEHNENFGFDIKEFDELAKLYLENLNVDDPEFFSSLGMSSEYNQMIPNLIVCTNIYSSKIPKNPGDPPFAPKMHRFEGPDCVQEFIEFAISYNKGNNYFCAHNGSGFDSKFIYQTGLNMDITLDQIMRGSNFIKLTLKGSTTHNCKKTTFIDNMLHLPGSLAGLAQDFFGNSEDENLRNSMAKGYFPHGFNRAENQNYIGPIPSLDNFTPETMKLGSGESRFDAVIKIQKWHSEYKGDWDFKKEINKYCDLDVLILAALMKEYMAIGIPKGAIPLMFTTAPAYVHELILLRATEHLVCHEMDLEKLKKVLRLEGVKCKDDLSKKAYALRKSNTDKHLAQMEAEAKRGWAVLKPPEYNMVRLSLRGGRTEIRSSQMTLSPEEEALGIKIMYQDVTSLYPAMQLTKQFCIGVPEINVYDYEYRPCFSCRNSGDSYKVKCLCEKKGYTGDSLDIKEHYAYQPTAQEILDDDSFFGYVCVSLIPPTNLYHPVVQIKKTTYKENGKVANIKCQNNLVLDDHKELYLDTPTFKKCLTSGYKLEKLFRFDKYKSGLGGWVTAGIEFYVDKERTSGPPPSLLEKGNWVAEYIKTCPNQPRPSCDREAYIALNEYIVPGLGKKLAESLEKDVWSKQPAKRKVFKIFNNCGWGKHAQRPIMPKTQTLDSCKEVNSIETIFHNISNGTSVLGGVQVYNQGRKMLFTFTEAKRDPQLHNTYLAAGAMVPAYGRLCLLEGLEISGERVAMCDTDSIIYKTTVDPKGNIPISSLLGRFKEEEISEDGIIEFVGFGPKCYSIKTRKNVDIMYPDGSVKKEPLTFTKLKGISQTVETQGVDHSFMFDTMTEYLKTGKVGSVKVPQWGIKTNMCLNGAPCIYTQNYLKDFKLMSDDNIKGYRINSGVKIYPFGFVPK